jgi:hypothetical protein
VTGVTEYGAIYRLWFHENITGVTH